MYRTCLFCHAELGSNEVLERFPVGQQLGFDPQKGRLWVICQGCRRWNLSPLESRWEVVEDCERLFREIRRRASTENIGLAHHDEGLELVRIGRPLLPEFAAWRYGDELLGRRWHGVRKTLRESSERSIAENIAKFRGALAGTPYWLAGAAVIDKAPAWPLLWPFGIGLVGMGCFKLMTTWDRKFDEIYEPIRQRQRRPLGSIVTEAGEVLLLRASHVSQARLEPRTSPEGWCLRLPADREDMPDRRAPLEVVGDEAIRSLRLALPEANRYGASKSTLGDAVGAIEAAGRPNAYFAHATEEARRGGYRYTMLGQLPAPLRLALEIAANEERERHALEGDLWLLEQEWREAEELAAIADALLLPEGVEALLQRLRSKADFRAGGEAE